MRISFRESARDDLIRQFRYYLITQDQPAVALRFREAVKQSVRRLHAHPGIGASHKSDDPKLQSFRSWPVSGFRAIRLYYLLERDQMQIVRMLHGKRDIERLLRAEAGNG